MTVRVTLSLAKTEPYPVEVHKLFIGRYPAAEQTSLLRPGDTLDLYVWPGQELLVREPEPQEG